MPCNTQHISIFYHTYEQRNIPLQQATRNTSASLLETDLRIRELYSRNQIHHCKKDIEGLYYFVVREAQRSNRLIFHSGNDMLLEGMGGGTAGDAEDVSPAIVR